MPHYAMQHRDGALSLRELQSKYEAVLAENEQLYHDLRTEQAQRARFESAYRRVQEEVQRDQKVLRHLYAHADEHNNSEELARDFGSSDCVPAHAVSTAGSSKDQLNRATNDAARIQALERDCAYLQAKVEGLHAALSRYERTDTGGETGGGASPPARGQPKRGSENGAHQSPAALKELQVEKAARQRAEEQLTRCHATLRSLRDDVAQKEFFFHQQLAALQEQNAALLEDLDTWVTGQQETYLDDAFASRFDRAAASKQNEQSLPSLPQQVVNNEPPAASAAEAQASLKIEQLQQYLKDQEDVIALKEKSIAQLEQHVQELSERLTKAETAAAAAAATVDVSGLFEGLAQLHREAAQVEDSVERFANLHLPGTYSLPPSSQRQLQPGTTRAVLSPKAMCSEIRSVLRYIGEVLSYESAHCPPPHQPRRDAEPVLRAPPATVVQPAALSGSYHSGETLSEAAQSLAKLMRRHVQ